MIVIYFNIKYTSEGPKALQYIVPWYRRIYNWLLGFDDSEKAQVSIGCWYMFYISYAVF